MLVLSGLLYILHLLLDGPGYVLLLLKEMHGKFSYRLLKLLRISELTDLYNLHCVPSDHLLQILLVLLVCLRVLSLINVLVSCIYDLGVLKMYVAFGKKLQSQ